jgi:hypothetical protein
VLKKKQFGILSLAKSVCSPITMMYNIGLHNVILRNFHVTIKKSLMATVINCYEGVSKSFRTGHGPALCH